MIQFLSLSSSVVIIFVFFVVDILLLHYFFFIIIVVQWHWWTDIYYENFSIIFPFDNNCCCIVVVNMIYWMNRLNKINKQKLYSNIEIHYIWEKLKIHQTTIIWKKNNEKSNDFDLKWPKTSRQTIILYIGHGILCVCVYHTSSTTTGQSWWWSVWSPSSSLSLC